MTDICKLQVVSGFIQSTLYVYSLDKLIHPRGFIYHLYVIDFQSFCFCPTPLLIVFILVFLCPYSTHPRSNSPLKPALSYLSECSVSRVRVFAIVKDCSPPNSSVHGILQARILEWVAMPSSRGSS